MNGVNPDNYLLFHPSIVQNPENSTGFVPLVNWNATQIDNYDNVPKNLGFSKSEIIKFGEILQPIKDRDSLNSIPTLLFYIFFSIKNVAQLQHEIQVAVYKTSGYKIGNQSEQVLGILMDSTFCDNRRQIDENNNPKTVVEASIKNEVKRLNNIVVSIALPVIINEILQYMQFQSSYKKPFTDSSLARPEVNTVKGNKVLRDVSDLFTN